MDEIRSLIREAIDKGKIKNVTALAAISGVSQANLSRFMTKKRSKLRYDTVQRIIDVIAPRNSGDSMKISKNGACEALNFWVNLRGEKQVDLAQKVGVSQSELSNMLNGRRGISIDNLGKFCAALDVTPDEFFNRIPTSRVSVPPSTEESTENTLPTIPVIGEGEAENRIPVLPGYYRDGLWAVKIRGDSMEPIIKPGAYVGVIPPENDLEEGGLYLVHQPPFGYVVKRVRIGANGEILLCSEKRGVPPLPASMEGKSPIAGKVAWVWQIVN